MKELQTLLKQKEAEESKLLESIEILRAEVTKDEIKYTNLLIENEDTQALKVKQSIKDKQNKLELLADKQTALKSNSETKEMTKLADAKYEAIQREDEEAQQTLDKLDSEYKELIKQATSKLEQMKQVEEAISKSASELTYIANNLVNWRATRENFRKPNFRNKSKYEYHAHANRYNQHTIDQEKVFKVLGKEKTI